MTAPSASAGSWPATWLPGWSATVSVLIGIGILLVVIQGHVWRILALLAEIQRELSER